MAESVSLRGLGPRIFPRIQIDCRFGIAARNARKSFGQAEQRGVAGVCSGICRPQFAGVSTNRVAPTPTPELTSLGQTQVR